MQESIYKDCLHFLHLAKRYFTDILRIVFVFVIRTMPTLIVLIFVCITYCAVFVSTILFISFGKMGLLLLGGIGAVSIGLAHVFFGRKDYYKQLFYGAIAGGAIPMLLAAMSIIISPFAVFLFFWPIVLIPLMAIGVVATKQKQVHTSVVQSLLYVIIGYPVVFLAMAFTHMGFFTIKQALILPYPNSQEIVFNVEYAWIPTFPNVQDFYSTTDSIEEVLQYYTDRNGLYCTKVHDRMEIDNGVGTIIGYDIQCRNYRALIINKPPSPINRRTDTIADECKNNEAVCTWIRLAINTNNHAIVSEPWFYFDRRY